MDNIKSKENILKKIRNALANPTPIPFPNSEGNSDLFETPTQDLDILFAEKFISLQGQFVFCENEKDFNLKIFELINSKNWKSIYCRETNIIEILEEKDLENIHSDDLTNCDASITACSKLIARTGTIVLNSNEESGRTVSVYAPVHICVAYTNQIVFDIKDALDSLKSQYQNTEWPSFITFASGPSRTADIEKTLVTGVHGPKEVFLFLIDKS